MFMVNIGKYAIHILTWMLCAIRFVSAKLEKKSSQGTYYALVAAQESSQKAEDDTEVGRQFFCRFIWAFEPWKKWAPGCFRLVLGDEKLPNLYGDFWEVKYEDPYKLTKDFNGK